jgi:hypothetical protein
VLSAEAARQVNLSRTRSTVAACHLPPTGVVTLRRPEFSELERALQIYLHEVTLRVIRKEVYSDTSEAQEVPEALPLN